MPDRLYYTVIELDLPCAAPVRWLAPTVVRHSPHRPRVRSAEVTMVALHIALLLPVGVALLLRLRTNRFAWAYFRQAAQHWTPLAWSPAVSIIVPVRGLEPAAPANFRRLLQQVYPADYELIFAVEDPDDPAVSLIETVRQAHPAVSSQLVISSERDIPATGKLKNLIAGVATCRGDVLIFVDSDVQVAPTFVADTVGNVADSEVGLAFAAPVAGGAEDWVAALHNVIVTASALHYAASAYRDRLQAAVGSVMAIRRTVLQDIGGLEQFAGRVVGIDISLGQVVRQAGYRIRLLPQPARIPHAHDQLPRLWWQLHRWMVTIRRYYPAFPAVALLVGLPLWWSLLFLGVAVLRGRLIRLGMLVVVGVLGTQISMAAVTNAKLSQDQRWWRYGWVAGISELVWLPVLVHSLLSPRIYWRGRWLEIHRDLTAELLEQ